MPQPAAKHVAGTDGLVGYWQANGDVVDATGNGNDGTLQGNASYAPGVEGDAFSFSGAGDFASLGNGPDVNMTSAFTVSAWVKPEATSASGMIIFNKENSYEAAIYGNSLFWALWVGGGWVGWVDSGLDLPSGEWSQVVFSYGPGEVRVYVNGVAAPVFGIRGGTLNQTSYDLQIGRRPLWGSQQFIGQIDEVLLYDRALTVEEAEDLAGDTGDHHVPGLTDDHCEPVVEQFRAGQTKDVGNVKIWDDGVNLFVQYNTTGDWELQHTHVNVSTSLEDVPQSGGGAPTNGQFTVQTAHDPRVTSYTYTLPLADYSGDQLYILTHSETILTDGNGNRIGEDTGYGGNNVWPTGNRWAYFTIYEPCGSGGGGDDEFDACDTNQDGIVDEAEALLCNPVDETHTITGNVSWADDASTDIEGLTVELLDAAGNVLATATTDADGNYSFTELPDGDYTVQVAAGQIAQDGTGPQAVTLAGADGSADFVFELPTISGDLSWADDGSTAIAGIAVELLDGNGTVIATATTDADGAYSFQVLPGDYTVQVAAGQIDQDVTGSQSVTVAANGADVADVDFVAQLPTISGTIAWADDATTPIAGIEVALSNGQTVITDADGNYSFTVLPGDYTVDVSSGQIAQDYSGTQSISIGADSNYASVEDVDFVYQLPTISGNVYFDITGDLLLSSDEPGIEGVTVTLSNGQTVASDADGNYSFTVLPGDYTVSVGDVDGMDLTTAASVDISINADTQYKSVEGVDFGFALNIADFCGQVADGFTIGFWKNNTSKAIAGRTKGVQVDAATISAYVDAIADYSLETFDGINEQSAVEVLSSKSSDAVDLLAKQLMGSEFNLMNGAYIGGNELATEMFIHYGEYLVKHAGDYSRDELLDAKDWFDAYNNSHGGAISGPDCE